MLHNKPWTTLLSTFHPRGEVGKVLDDYDYNKQHPQEQQARTNTNKQEVALPHKKKDHNPQEQRTGKNFTQPSTNPKSRSVTVDPASPSKNTHKANRSRSDTVLVIQSSPYRHRSEHRIQGCLEHTHTGPSLWANAFIKKFAYNESLCLIGIAWERNQSRPAPPIDKYMHPFIRSIIRSRTHIQSSSSGQQAATQSTAPF